MPTISALRAKQLSDVLVSTEIVHQTELSVVIICFRSHLKTELRYVYSRTYSVNHRSTHVRDRFYSLCYKNGRT